MSNLLGKLAAVMFYAAIPLLIPFFFSLYTGDGGWFPIGITTLILAFPAVPQMILGSIKNLNNFIGSVLYPDKPFNYAKVINTEEIRKKVEVLTLGEILVVTSVAWILVPVLSIGPYLYYNVPIVDAVFESFSGWTSTGLSALPTVTILPPSVILFRSLTQWVGGLGIVILILSTLRGREAISFLKAEGRQQAKLGVGQTVNLTFRVYLAITLAAIILMLITGFDIFNSVNLAMSGVSNGGFFPFDSYDLSSIQKLALALILFGGSTSFLFYDSIWQGKWDKGVIEEEFILYVFIAVLGILMIFAVGKEDIFNTILNTISAFATGGFSIGDLSVLHSFSIYLLVLLMICGGMVGSTTGGLKLWRILVILKALGLQVKESFLPHGSVQMVKINGLPINERMIVESATFVFAYLIVFLVGSGVFLAVGYELHHALFLVATAMGNVGLSTTYIPAMGEMAKIFLMVLMYLGRIEIFPCLALIGYFVRR